MKDDEMACACKKQAYEDRSYGYDAGAYVSGRKQEKTNEGKAVRKRFEDHFLISAAAERDRFTHL